MSQTRTAPSDPPLANHDPSDTAVRALSDPSA
jgi:hypothetical protein